uniref:Uncharacterized protein n=1 Tax=Ananas comosus var. bracteatus TaxID=296719 RepID=A0A6V7PR48_ANACO|nr:unnamed protein product [Ananas comosus var. bracteatus]
MCGGAIISDLIPPRKNSRGGSGIWPDSLFSGGSDGSDFAEFNPGGGRRGRGRGRGSGSGRRSTGDKAAAVGEVGGGDPGPGEGRARLARHLRHPGGRRPRLRPRRPPHPRQKGQAQLPLPFSPASRRRRRRSTPPPPPSSSSPPPPPQDHSSIPCCSSSSTSTATTTTNPNNNDVNGGGGEVERLCEELREYESVMSFFQIPYMEGGVAVLDEDEKEEELPPPPLPLPPQCTQQANAMGGLWSFDDAHISSIALL